MKVKRIIILMITCLFIVSCKTIDIEKQMANDLENENKTLKDDIETLKQALQMRTTEDEYTYSVEPVIINTKEYVVINETEFKKLEEEKKVGKDAVSQSLKESFVELEDYIGGTSYFDYDSNRQFPIFTKELSLTTIILGADEQMAEGSAPFMSDTTTWEITGDVWETSEGSRQLVMIKPKKSGLETNMLIVTNKRLYHFVLYSTNKDYQPMVQFRYPLDKPFIVANTKKVSPSSVKSVYDNIDPELVSFNYKITVPFFSRKVDWIPKKVYDDGSRTYILLPEVVLQKEFPSVWEGKEEITNYLVDPDYHNLIIINKLVESVTLRIGKKEIKITKTKGEGLFSIMR